MRIKPIKPKKSRFFTEKSGTADGDVNAERINRTVYVTVAVLLIVLAVAVAMTGAANKAKKEALESSGAGGTARVPAPRVTTAAGDEKKLNPAGEETGNDGQVGKVVPTMSLPVAGSLGNIHDPSIQVFSDTLVEWRVHLGVDFLTQAGAAVSAAADGTVEAVGSDPLMGTYVSIRHNGGAVTVYKNLSETLADGIRAGAKVKSGQLLGSVGESAILELAEEPHLHFEMTVGGESVDPLNYFSTDSLRALQAAADTGYEDK